MAHKISPKDGINQIRAPVQMEAAAGIKYDLLFPV